MKQAAKMAEEQAAQEAAEKQSASAQSQPDSQQVPTHDLWCHGCLPATSSFAIGHRNWTSLVSSMHCLLVSSLPWCASQVLLQSSSRCPAQACKLSMPWQNSSPDVLPASAQSTSASRCQPSSLHLLQHLATTAQLITCCTGDTAVPGRAGSNSHTRGHRHGGAPTAGAAEAAGSLTSRQAQHSPPRAQRAGHSRQQPASGTYIPMCSLDLYCSVHAAPPEALLRGFLGTPAQSVRTCMADGCLAGLSQPRTSLPCRFADGRQRCPISLQSASNAVSGWQGRHPERSACQTRLHMSDHVSLDIQDHGQGPQRAPAWPLHVVLAIPPYLGACAEQLQPAASGEQHGGRLQGAPHGGAQQERGGPVERTR